MDRRSKCFSRRKGRFLAGGDRPLPSFQRDISDELSRDRKPPRFSAGRGCRGLLTEWMATIRLRTFMSGRRKAQACDEGRSVAFGSMRRAKQVVASASRNGFLAGASRSRSVEAPSAATSCFAALIWPMISTSLGSLTRKFASSIGAGMPPLPTAVGGGLLANGLSRGTGILEKSLAASSVFGVFVASCCGPRTGSVTRSRREFRRVNLRINWLYHV